MKKNSILSFFFFSFSFAYSQTSSLALWDSITNVSNGFIVVNVEPNKNYKREIKIQNPTASDINYKVERIYLTAPICSGAYLYFCATGLCLPPDSAISQFSFNDVILANQTLPSGNGSFGIEPHFDLDSNCCSEDVMYKVHNINNANDFVTVTIRYVCSAIGIDESETINGIVAKAYPNPANSSFHIQYAINRGTLSSKIIIHDMLGKVIKELQLKDKQGIEKVETENMQAGIYFYSVVIDNVAILTKKIIISNE